MSMTTQQKAPCFCFTSSFLKGTSPSQCISPANRRYPTSVLQCAAVRCSVVQCAAVCYSVSPYVKLLYPKFKEKRHILGGHGIHDALFLQVSIRKRDVSFVTDLQIETFKERDPMNRPHPWRGSSLYCSDDPRANRDNPLSGFQDTQNESCAIAIPIEFSLCMCLCMSILRRQTPDPQPIRPKSSLGMTVTGRSASRASAAATWSRPDSRLSEGERPDSRLCDIATGDKEEASSVVRALSYARPASAMSNMCVNVCGWMCVCG